jgi:hemolysin III
MVVERAKPTNAAGEPQLVGDAIVHAVGLILGLIGGITIVTIAARSPIPGQVVPIAVYVGGLLAMLSCSATYNLWQSSSRRELLRRLDHAAIFLMIAGSYTPLAILRLSNGWGVRLTFIVWTAAAAGIAVKLWQPRCVESISVVLYLLLGWIGLIALDALLASVEEKTLIMLLIGGLIYSAGVIFHVSNHRRYNRVLWHGCVLAAAMVHYFAFVSLVQA